MEGKAKSRAAILDRPSSLNALSSPMVLFFEHVISYWWLEAHLYASNVWSFFSRLVG